MAFMGNASAVKTKCRFHPSTVGRTISAELNTKNQHYVWRHYLDAWAADGTFCCYRERDKKLFLTQPKAVASETYFYETAQLTDSDMQFLETTISQATHEGLRELNRNYVKMTQAPFQIGEYLKGPSLTPEARADLQKELRWIKINGMERYHAHIENKCRDILDSLQNGDDAFYKDDGRCSDFLYFLSLQYFRTAKMREGFSNIPNYVPGHNPRRTASTLRHIVATNLAAGLFMERRAYRIVFLHNHTCNPFITGDQPVVNMLDPRETNDVALYYPLLPRLALVLTKDTVKFPVRERELSLFEVERYNYAIYRNSEDQIYSNDKVYMGGLVTMGKDVLAT